CTYPRAVPSSAPATTVATRTAATPASSAVARRRVVTSCRRLRTSAGLGGGGLGARRAEASVGTAAVYPTLAGAHPAGRSAGAVADGLEGALDLGPVLRAPHRREGVDDLPPVASGGQAGVQHGDDAAVLGRADEPSGALGEERRGPRQVDQAERRGPGPLSAGLQQRLVRAGEGDPVDGHDAEGPAGHVHALPEPERG